MNLRGSTRRPLLSGRYAACAKAIPVAMVSTRRVPSVSELVQTELSSLIRETWQTWAPSRSPEGGPFAVLVFWATPLRGAGCGQSGDLLEVSDAFLSFAGGGEDGALVVAKCFEPGGQVRRVIYARFESQSQMCT